VGESAVAFAAVMRTQIDDLKDNAETQRAQRIAERWRSQSEQPWMQNCRTHLPIVWSGLRLSKPRGLGDRGYS
jgi:hypothetical protein